MSLNTASSVSGRRVAQGSDDTLTVLLGLVCVACWWTIKRTAWAITHPSVLLPLVPVVCVWASWHFYRWAGLAPWVVAVLAFVAACLLGWGPALVVWRVLVRFGCWWWRRWVTYGARWVQVTSACRIALPHPVEHGRTLVPGVSRVHLTACGERVRIVLPVGMDPGVVASRVEVLGHALGTVRPLRVHVTGPRVMVLDVQRLDPLVATVTPALLPAPRADLATLDGVPVGLTEHGQTWRLPVAGAHTFVGGATGSGKGSILWSLLGGLGPSIKAGAVQVWAIDPKGGMELWAARPLCARFTTDADGAADLLDDAVSALKHRAARLCGVTRAHAPTPEDPLVVVVVDELADLTVLCRDHRLARRIDQALGVLISQGRAVGFSVVSFTQVVTKDAASWRDLHTHHVALRLAKPLEVDMVLGQGARDAGAASDRISHTTPGAAFVWPAGADPVAVRAAWVDDTTAARIVQRYAPQRVIPITVPAGREHTDRQAPPQPQEQPQDAPVDLAKRPRSPRKPRAPRAPRQRTTGADRPSESRGAES